MCHMGSEITKLFRWGRVSPMRGHTAKCCPYPDGYIPEYLSCLMAYDFSFLFPFCLSVLLTFSTMNMLSSLTRKHKLLFNHKVAEKQFLGKLPVQRTTFGPWVYVCLLSIPNPSFYSSEGSQKHRSKASNCVGTVPGCPAVGPLHSANGKIMRETRCKRRHK